MATNADESRDAAAAIEAGADPEIVKEMEAEGELPSAPEGDSGDGEQPEHVETTATEAAAAAEGDEPDAAAAAGAAEEGDRNRGGEGEGEGQQPDRRVQHIPAWKAKEMEKKAREEGAAEAKSTYDAELARIAKQQGGASEDDIAKFAEEFGLQPDAATKFLERATDMVSKGLGIDDMRKRDAERAERERAAEEERGFTNEWDSKTTQDALKAAAGDHEITAEVKEKVKELAYSSTYARYRLPDLIRLEASTLFGTAPVAAPSAEAGRGGTRRGAPAKSESKTLNDLSADDIDSMSDEEFASFSDGLGGGGSRFTKTTTPKKGGTR